YSRPEDPRATPERAVAVTATGWQRVMPAAPPGARFAGSKTIAASVQNGLASYLITLFDQHDSRLAALIDGNRITGIRTAATAAAALSALLPDAAVDAAVVGSGFEARAQLRAAARVARLRSVRVSSPTAANRERFADELGADATIVSVGSTTPPQRELDPALIGRATFIVADALAEVLHDSGDMIAAREAGFAPDTVTVSLHDLLSRRASRPDGIAIYKSTASGFHDIVLAQQLYDRAVVQ